MYITIYRYAHLYIYIHKHTYIYVSIYSYMHISHVCHDPFRDVSAHARSAQGNFSVEPFRKTVSKVKSNNFEMRVWPSGGIGCLVVITFSVVDCIGFAIVAICAHHF